MDNIRRRFRLFISISLLVCFICCTSLVSCIIRIEASGTRCIECIESERKALLLLKKGFVDDYGLLSSWRSHSSSQDCCLWPGVGCSNRTGHVVMLDLHGYWPDGLDAAVGLSGDISSSLLDLNHLNHLDLSFSSLTRIPKFMGSLGKLRYLNFSFVTFEVSKVPPQLGNLSYLQILDLSGSSAVLKNTEWLFKLSSLEYLSLNDVELSESRNLLENMLTRLHSLFELHLAGCLFSSLSANKLLPVTNFSRVLSILDISDDYLPPSMIYPWVFNFSDSLTNIDLSFNELNDTIPEAFGAFTSLQKLDLTGTSLKGRIPTSFGNFSNLQSLYLGRNSLEEDLPSFFHLLEPAEKSLQVLDLSENEFFGSLPDFTKFTALQELHLYANDMRGSFPERFENKLKGTITETHLSNLSHLVYFDLSYNSLVLEIDPNWSPTFSLNVLTLASCKLDPSFPIWLQNQKNFSILDISDAQINDSVPDWFWDQLPPNLQTHYIDLSSNNFFGPVPLFPSNTLKLILGDNMFSGSVSFLCNFTIIYGLELSNNQLSKDLPDCWMNINQLLFLNLENNKFSGRIPTSLGSLSQLKMLSMRNNRLTGELPSSLKNCTMLTLLDVGENSLSGHIPTWIGKSLLALRVLSLTNNRFHGNFPAHLCRLSNTQILDLSVNNISGIIPRCLSNFKGMTEGMKDASFFEWRNVVQHGWFPFVDRYVYLFQAFLQWEGRKYQYSNTLHLVTSLDLSSNSLNGDIPHDITKLSGLVALNLSRNNLTWIIPQDIGRLRWLDFLDLSRNHLTGGIPTSLSQLASLGMLDLSHNNLSGRIPSSTQLQSFDASSYSGNPALCGLPLRNPCPGDLVPQNPRTTVETEDIEDQEDKLITQGFFICLWTGLAFGFVGFCGSLVLSDSWRHAYFKFWDHVENWIYVVIAVDYNRLQRQS